MASVGFIGLGNMGGPMADNLLKAGFDVTVFDLSAAACAALEAQGAAVAASAAAAASGRDFVISMLPAGRHVRGLYLGDGEDDGLLACVDGSVTLLDCSTIDAGTARKVGEAAAEPAASASSMPRSPAAWPRPVPAPWRSCAAVTRWSSHAPSRCSTPWAGRAFTPDRRAPGRSPRPATTCSSRAHARHLRGPGHGERHGLDPAVLSEIMLASSGRNWSLEVYNPWPGVQEGSAASNDYQPGFMVDLMAKDLGLARDVAAAAGVDNRMGPRRGAVRGAPGRGQRQP
jgi:3-hydroxyisobutyrate dehydrogenase